MSRTKKKSTKKPARKKTAKTRKKPTASSAALARHLLEPEEIESILKACGEGDTADRNRALVALMSGTGLRIAEALAVEERDLELGKRRVHVRQGKGNKDRHIWLDPKAVEPVRAWMKVRRRLKVKGSAPVFCSLAGAPLSASYVRRVLPKIGKAAGLSKRVHSHALRHAFACNAHREKVSLRALQLQLGHSSISATSGYLERIGLEAVFADFEDALD